MKRVTTFIFKAFVVLVLSLYVSKKVLSKYGAYSSIKFYRYYTESGRCRS